MLIIVGNPPYNANSTNIYDVTDYHKLHYADGTSEPLREKQKKNLQDDYVKFIRWGTKKIVQAQQGILGVITPHGFGEAITFRGMRTHLLRSYDKIMFLDLNGNLRRKRVTIEGSPDQNIFDIMQGVAISIFVRTTKNKEENKAPFGTVHSAEVEGSRRLKEACVRDYTKDVLLDIAIEECYNSLSSP